MLNKYDYLTQYIKNLDKDPASNYFQKFDQNRILEAEQRLGYQFPVQIKEFWQKIGCGFLKKSIESIGLSTYDLDNRIMPPEDIANIVLLKEESELILPEAAEYLEPDEMPFFEIGSLSSFLIMKPLSAEPNAVYDFGGRIIEKDFETFIYNLYYKSPIYYLQIYDNT